MKHVFIILGIYIMSLLLSVFGAFIDSDIRENSFEYLVFEVIVMSVFTFVFLSGLVYALYYSFLFLKNKIENNNLIN
ncbi:hypothetical protein [Flavobacterium sp.]|uniref:hypothetical protein n=1 Tax=Flavobacterium sp. TaxID=239 RepID=UPI003751EDCC